MTGYKFYAVHPQLQDTVEAIWEADIPQAAAARTIVLPVMSPILCFHYRVAPDMALNAFGTERDENWIETARHRLTGAWSRAARLRRVGPVGGIMVRLRPHAASRILRSPMQEFSNRAFAIADVFSPNESSMLDGQLLEASGPEKRVAAVQACLLARLHDRSEDRLVGHALSVMRRSPGLRIGRLAEHLDVSERHLVRRFQSATGASPKEAARIMRLSKVISTVRQGRASWAGAAQLCGFSDQSHMVREFTTMVGLPPDTFFRNTSLKETDESQVSRAESDFYNTFVLEQTIPELVGNI